MRKGGAEGVKNGKLASVGAGGVLLRIDESRPVESSGGCDGVHGEELVDFVVIEIDVARIVEPVGFDDAVLNPAVDGAARDFQFAFQLVDGDPLALSGVVVLYHNISCLKNYDAKVVSRNVGRENSSVAVERVAIVGLERWMIES